jgi:hypothetical protein
MVAFTRSLFRTLLLLLCLVLLTPTACAGPSIEQDPTGGETSREEDSGEVYETPDKGINVVIPTPNIPQTTRIISPETASQVMRNITVTDDSLVFSRQALAEAGLPDIQVDEVLVIDPVEGAPNGILRRVTAVSTNADGNLVAETVPASLTEAIQTGVINYTYEGEVLSFSAPGRPSGLAKRHAAPLQDVNLSHDFGDVEVNGIARIIPRFELDIIIDDYQLKLLRFVDKTSVSGRLEANGKLENANIDYSHPVFSIELSPTPVDVNDTIMDVWITPSVEVYVGARGNVTANMTAVVEQDITMNTGLFYPDQNGKFYWGLEPEVGEMVYKTPVYSMNSDLKAYVRPELTLKVFEFGGPYTGVDAFLKLDVDTDRSPLWQLWGGVEGDIGVRIKFLSFIIEDWNYDLLYEEWLIAEDGFPVAGEPPAPAETEEPPPEPEETEEPPEAPPSEPAETEEPTEAPPPPADALANVYMVYDDNAAAVINNSGGTISLLGVTFQRLSDQGAVTAEFPSSFWGHAYGQKPITALPPGDCFIVSKSGFSLPADCNSVWSWFTTSGQQFYFWSAVPGSDTFQVLKGDQVVALCAIPERSCSFKLPQP